jgi:hypothetical protein
MPRQSGGSPLPGGSLARLQFSTILFANAKLLWGATVADRVEKADQW